MNTMRRGMVGLVAAGLLAAGQGVWGAEADTIKIGGLFDLSGKAQHIGAPTKEVAQMVVDRVNKQGGIKGRKIELVVADTQSEPSQTVVALKRLLEKDNVVAVIGPTTTGAAMACLKEIDTAKRPMVACVGGDAPVTPVRPWVFKTPQKTSVAVARVYAHLQKNNLKKVALLCAGDKFGQEGQDVLEKLAPGSGIQIVAKESFDPAKDLDMSVQLRKAVDAKPDAIVVWTIGPAGATIAKNARQAGIAVPLFQCHGQPDANYIKLGGEAVNGTAMPATKLMAAEQLADTDKQKALVLEFIAAYKAKGLGEIGTHSGYAWDAVQLVCNAIEKGGAEPAAIRDALEKTTGYVGVSGIFSLSPEDHNGLGVDSLVMVKVENGKWKLIE